MAEYIGLTFDRISNDTVNTVYIGGEAGRGGIKQVYQNATLPSAVIRVLATG